MSRSAAQYHQREVGYSFAVRCVSEHQLTPDKRQENVKPSLRPLEFHKNLYTYRRRYTYVVCDKNRKYSWKKNVILEG